ncbi:MAG TPA: hypothetical protein VFS39_16280 [Nitrospira sp.]|nr:hypothetical protein [Nitrospira sp.]
MDTVRREVLYLARACEYFLSSTSDPPLSHDERDLVVYYINELAQKFELERVGRNPYPHA